MAIIIGTAGWAIPRAAAEGFGTGGSILQRFATRFTGVEINSSFYRPHRSTTWARWAAGVPDRFRFAVKIPKVISHERRLAGCVEALDRFLSEAHELGDKLAILLLQLPPSFAYEAALVEDFVGMIRERSSAALVCEPRHPSWFEGAPDRALDRLGVARVAADPACVPAAAHPGGWRG